MVEIDSTDDLCIFYCTFMQCGFWTRLSSMTSIAGPETMPWILEAFPCPIPCRTAMFQRPLARAHPVVERLSCPES